MQQTGHFEISDILNICCHRDGIRTRTHRLGNDPTQATIHHRTPRWFKNHSVETP